MPAAGAPAQGAAAQAQAAPAPEAKPLSAFGLLWGAIKAWFRAVFAR
jgi:hypothetical protein